VASVAEELLRLEGAIQNQIEAGERGGPNKADAFWRAYLMTLKAGIAEQRAEVEAVARGARNADWHSPADSRDRDQLISLAARLAPEEK